MIEVAAGGGTGGSGEMVGITATLFI